ncbi:YbaN family protein [Ectopseudomonas hydrolytica]|uniref:YbaN family protein n=1 Tax=Ectopseudomonas hydrolytica TaxID=2493633 RepID=UPI0020B7F4A7|nr:YbaN family protein [Pseudomonas hydrolytica]UTH31613.1 YbaN family protein [Pseudomonas hydrolytica]
MPETRLARAAWQRWLWLLLAYLCLGIAMLGVVLPGLPTTEFVLLAAWAASRSSPRLAAWLENHRLFGPLLRDWRLHGVVLRRTKWAASLSMLLALSILLLTVDHLPSVLFAAAGMSCGALFIWTRPEKPRVS